MFDVLSVGLIAGDIIVSPVDKEAVQIDAGLPIENVKYFCGGDALNAAFALNKLGMKAALAGVVGDDVFEPIVKHAAADCGADISRVRVVKGICTSTSIILCEENGERHFFAYSPTANNLFTADMIDDESIKNCELLYVGSTMALKGLDGAGLKDLFARAKKFGKTTAFDCTNDAEGLWLKKIEAALPYTDIFLPSLEEAEQVTGKKDVREMARFMAGYGLKIFGVKLGTEGAFLTDFKEEHFIKCFQAKAVDTTGAGDCFCAGFMTAYLRGLDLYSCGVFASGVSRFCVEAFGATTNIPAKETVLAFIEQQIAGGVYQPVKSPDFSAMKKL